MINELFIYGEIGESWFSSFVTDADVAEALATLDGSNNLDVYINSVGGRVDQGLSIMNTMRQYGKKMMAINPDFKMRTIVTGFAYSAATLVMLGADIRVMQPGTKAMVHLPMMGLEGNYKDFEKIGEHLKGSADYVASLYSQATGKEKATWTDLMENETFFTATEAVKVGLATVEESFSPLKKTEKNEATDFRRVLIPSSVYESNKEQFDKVSILGKGAYYSTIMKGRAPTPRKEGVSAEGTEIAEENISKPKLPDIELLQRKLDYDILVAESK